MLHGEGSPVRWGIGFALTSLVLATAALAPVDPAGAPTAWPGPPWISIEVPPNPLDRETRDAFLVVRTYHHQHDASYEVTGNAEGLVRGARKSLPLELTATSRTGVYALAKQWPDDGVWVLAIDLNVDGKRSATALVELDGSGQVAAIRVPSRKAEGGRWTIPIPASDEEVEATLHARAAQLAVATNRD